MTWAAALMAGGESRRMGSDKAVLEWRGEPLWARQWRALRELRPAALWISARTRPVWCPPEIETILDLAPSCGPLSGLAASLSEGRAEHLLALAVDLPEMTVGHLRKLLDLTQPGVGVMARNAGRFEPLCAVYPKEAGALAAEALRRQEGSLQSLVRTLLANGLLNVYEVPVSERALYRNLNTPGDL